MNAGRGQGVGPRRRSKALAAGAGFSSGTSLIIDSGAPPAAAGLRAVATLVTGLSAGPFLMTPVSSTEASAPVFAAKKTAFGLGSWAANIALARSESTVSSAWSSGASAAARSFLRMLSSEPSAPDFAGTSFARAFLAPHA